MAEYDREQVEARLNERESELKKMRQGIDREEEGMNSGELADVDQHPADSGTEMYEQELDETTKIMIDEGEQRIAEARKSLEAGTYGTCIVCGKDIPPARLEAQPEAVRCVEDQERYEAGLRTTHG